MASSPPNRRRERSARLTVAVASLVIAAAFVGYAVTLGTPLLIVASATCAVLLGVLATFLTYGEVRLTRLGAARERADLAHDYQQLAAARATEEESFREVLVERLGNRQAEIAQLQAAMAELETALGAAQRRAALASKKHEQEMRRAEAAEATALSIAARLEESEQRAAAAVVRVAELEAELDAVRVELDAAHAEVQAWQSSGPVRKHA
ncbi:MAG: hypothetical protein WAW88_09320 [Nocardioides sp.]